MPALTVSPSPDGTAPPAVPFWDRESRDRRCKHRNMEGTMPRLTREQLDSHEHERHESWPIYDAQGIYLCRVCDECEDAKLGTFRPEILTGYSQADVDEPIESD